MESQVVKLHPQAGFIFFPKDAFIHVHEFEKMSVFCIITDFTTFKNFKL